MSYTRVAIGLASAVLAAAAWQTQAQSPRQAIAECSFAQEEGGVSYIYLSSYIVADNLLRPRSDSVSVRVAATESSHQASAVGRRSVGWLSMIVDDGAVKDIRVSEVLSLSRAPEDVRLIVLRGGREIGRYPQPTDSGNALGRGTPPEWRVRLAQSWSRSELQSFGPAFSLVTADRKGELQRHSFRLELAAVIRGAAAVEAAGVRRYAGTRFDPADFRGGRGDKECQRFVPDDFDW